MAFFQAGPLGIDTDNKTITVDTPNGGSVVIDGGSGTVTSTGTTGNWTVSIGTAPNLPMPFSGHYIKGYVFYFPSPGGILNGVIGATVTVTAIGTGRTFTLATDARGAYEGPLDNAVTDQLFVATVTLGGRTISNLPLPYNPFAGEFFPIVVPIDWIDAPVPVNNFFRRSNVVSLSNGEQQSLADFIKKDFLARDNGRVVGIHMEQIDHLTALFSDHKTYVWQLEKALIRAGKTEFVPLPLWEPLKDIPTGFDQVQVTAAMMAALPIYRYINPLYNTTNIRFRPAIPNHLKPANIGGAGFPTAHSLALYIGRSAASALGSFHFNAHFMSGGPFFDMSFAAGAVLFWPVHALLVDIYDSWVATKFTGRNLRSVVTARVIDGKRYPVVFTVTERRELWRSYTRDVVLMRNDISLLEAKSAVAPLFDPEHVMDEHEPEWPHWSHWEMIDSCPVVDLIAVEGFKGRWVVLVVDDRGQFCLVRENTCGGVDHVEIPSAAVTAFTCATAADGRLQIAFVERRSAILNLGSETYPESGSFTWTTKGVPIPHAFVSMIQQVKSIRGRDAQVHLFASTLGAQSAAAARDSVREHIGGGRIRVDAVRSDQPSNTFSMVQPPTMFHLARGADNTWTLDEMAFSHLSIRTFAIANCHEDCITVFGINTDDHKIYAADLPIVPVRESRGGHSHGGPTHGRAHGHDVATVHHADRGRIGTPVTTHPIATLGEGDPQPVEWRLIDTGDLTFADLAVANDKNGRVEVFGIAMDGHVWHASEGDDWTTWSEIPLLPIMGTETLAIFAALDHNGCLNVFVHCGKENFIYVAEQLNGSEWVGWMNI